MRTREILVVGAVLVFIAGCDQRTNPLNPDAVVTVRDVREINTTIRIAISQVDSTNQVICEVMFDPGRLEITFQEEYGGQWATVYAYEVEYRDIDGNPLGITTLRGQTYVRIPPRGQATVNLAVVTEEIANYLVFQNQAAAIAHVVLYVKGDYQGQTIEGAGLTYTFPFDHTIFVYFRGCSPF